MSDFGTFWQLDTYANTQNTKISFEDMDFWPKILLILYPSLENSTTHITKDYSTLTIGISIYVKLSLGNWLHDVTEWRFELR